MQEEIIGIGDAFIVPTPPDHKHLYIIIAAISSEAYLLVSTTTSNTNIDPERDCIIRPGNNIPSFIRRECTIAYRYAREVRMNDIKKFLRSNQWIYDGTFPEESILEIRRKGLLSKSIKKKYKTALEEAINQYIFENQF